jgi:hypothetical protein
MIQSYENGLAFSKRDEIGQKMVAALLEKQIFKKSSRANSVVAKAFCGDDNSRDVVDYALGQSFDWLEFFS